MKVDRRTMLHGTAMASLASLVSGYPARSHAAQATVSQPNIVFIMADDLGYADIGCYGARDIRTPHIDALAGRGIRLTDGYANSPVCSATRTALITGRYQYRLPCGLQEPLAVGDYGLPPAEMTLPRLLQGLGYTTALVGKWHLGNLPDYGPLLSGYDRFFGIERGAADYFSHKSMAAPPPIDEDRLAAANVVSDPAGSQGLPPGLIEGTEPVEAFGYLTDVLGDRAVVEIEAAHRQGKPLFLSLHFTAPHWPWEGPDDAEVARSIVDQTHTDGGNLATYGAMVESMDANVGKVMATLDHLGIAENTIIVFTSDNGGERFSDVWPFTGAKTELLEGGIRVPLVISWPARISAGSTSSQAMMSMDFTPTFYAAAGGDASVVRSDGENLLPVLTGISEAYSRKLFWRYQANDQAAMREGHYKYLRLRGREYLFDLVSDQHERANLKDREPERFAAMKGEWEAWNATMLPYQDDSFSHDISDFLPDR